MSIPDPIRRVFSGDTQRSMVRGTFERPPRVLLPGAFNPLHDGHRKMAQFASEFTGKSVGFEISIDNIDKPAVTQPQICDRLHQFSDTETVWLTRAATFEEKAMLFPGTMFAIGVDTLQRIALPRYYGSSGNDDVRQTMRRSIERIEANNCCFLVFGRLIENVFQSAGDLVLDEPLKNLCHEISESLFREDISSTAIRKS